MIRKEPGYLSDGTPAYVHAVDAADTSPRHYTYPTGYDPACGWCWLGAPHTEREHERRIASEKSGA